MKQSKNSGLIHFIQEDFLLETKYAKEIYHDHVKDLPIIDYHNHLNPAEINSDKNFDNISQIWLKGDHYKWRAMRAHGISEQYITGEADDPSKFLKWAQTVPYTLRNPLYHWTHLELQRYFGIEEILNEASAKAIYEETSAMLKDPDYSVRNLLHKMNVELVCTTEDPSDSLSHHKAFSDQDPQLKMFTAFRPDQALLISADNYPQYIHNLGNSANIEIQDLNSLKKALKSRMDFFESTGCTLSDHGLSYIPFVEYDENELDQIVKKRLKGEKLSLEESEKYMTGLLFYLSQEYHRRSWVQQFHLGALRNTNTRLLKKLGPDTGWDSIGDFPQAQSMSKFFNALDSIDQLPKTIIYNLNPRDNEVFASMCGNFNDGSIVSKMQFGSAWWFLDQMDGMEKQLNAVSNIGLLSHFIGMLTDSRSFLSFPRHEYFRRILCNMFGNDIKNDRLPEDIAWIGKVASDISYYNAKNYFNFS